MASPTSVISSPMPLTDSVILTCASAAEYCALIVSFLLRKASTLAESLFSVATSFSCSCSIPTICWVSCSNCACSCALSVSAVRARSSLPASRAAFACEVCLSIFACSFVRCISSRFLEVATSATPRFTFRSISSCFW
ncbi:MAG: hypothetical protein DNFNHJIP_00731 [Candidatus Argoarchaeum ethanivorans]|uniref:Uncharacterized protein n=1 Tax=Candidatus Argoarchaeum ethanivorans TaxID=2608793 RepID=A0A812A3T2_9EURY|nr:MAG: hypothetical protein DNFNHJIP_00731 [Candidatus Argoarchaeum ethanivorans]